MSGAWFFLVASEAITVGDTTVKLPGIGTWIALAIDRKDITAVVEAVATMAVVVRPRNRVRTFSGAPDLPRGTLAGAFHDMCRAGRLNWNPALPGFGRWHGDRLDPNDLGSAEALDHGGESEASPVKRVGGPPGSRDDRRT